MGGKRLMGSHLGSLWGVIANSVGTRVTAPSPCLDPRRVVLDSGSDEETISASSAASSDSEDARPARDDGSRAGTAFPSTQWMPESLSLAPFRAKMPSIAAFRKQRVDLTASLFKEYNARIFQGRLPLDLEISWNCRLMSTAGITHCTMRRQSASLVHTARIELSTKVIDGPGKLRCTLRHELCHAACWLLDGCARPPHGARWRAWAQRAERAYPDLVIATCHNYDIFYPHRWQCLNPE